jgi:hypothetical protein
MKIELKGWKAIAALAIIAAVIGGKFLFERSTLAAEAGEEIKLHLRGEYASLLLHGVDTDALTDEEMEAKAQELLKLEDIQFTSMSARGRGEDVRVRLEIQVSGEDPPDGKPVRYYRLSHSTITGWRVRREITALSYYLKLSF